MATPMASASAVRSLAAVIEVSPASKRLSSSLTSLPHTSLIASTTSATQPRTLHVEPPCFKAATRRAVLVASLWSPPPTAALGFCVDARLAAALRAAARLATSCDGAGLRRSTLRMPCLSFTPFSFRLSASPSRVAGSAFTSTSSSGSHRFGTRPARAVHWRSCAIVMVWEVWPTTATPTAWPCCSCGTAKAITASTPSLPSLAQAVITACSTASDEITSLPRMMTTSSSRGLATFT